MFLVMREKTHRGEIKSILQKHRVFAFLFCASNLALNRQQPSIAENQIKHRVVGTLFIKML